MKNNNEQAVHDAVKAGINVLLPALLDTLGYHHEDGLTTPDALEAMSYNLSSTYDITATEAMSVVHYSLTEMGVSL